MSVGHAVPVGRVWSLPTCDKVLLHVVLLVLPYTVPCYQPLTTLPYLPNNVADFENNLNLFLIFLEYPVLFCN